MNPERSKDRAHRTLLAGICAVTFVVYLDTSITPVADTYHHPVSCCAHGDEAREGQRRSDELIVVGDVRRADEFESVDPRNARTEEGTDAVGERIVHSDRRRTPG